jgi:hypothetical protein
MTPTFNVMHLQLCCAGLLLVLIASSAVPCTLTEALKVNPGLVRIVQCAQQTMH